MHAYLHADQRYGHIQVMNYCLHILDANPGDPVRPSNLPDSGGLPAPRQTSPWFRSASELRIYFVYVPRMHN